MMTYDDVVTQRHSKFKILQIEYSEVVLLAHFYKYFQKNLKDACELHGFV